MNIVMKRGQVTVNGVTYSGTSVSIVGNQVFVDGKLQKGQVAGHISVTVQGDCQSIETQAGDVTVNGSVLGGVATGSGDVRCGVVGGNVRTGSGDVICGDVSGSISTGSGDVSYSGRARR